MNNKMSKVRFLFISFDSDEPSECRIDSKSRILTPLGSTSSRFFRSPALYPEKDNRVRENEERGERRKRNPNLGTRSKGGLHLAGQ